ncbi:MAG: HD-GYP domain-containing protein [Oscillospiraceae bacterium]|nr:HD-GYP domain-containing protein [Oscillospiraceae bacterium]
MGYDYLPVNISNIPVGLSLDCKVYVEKGGEYSFLCENVIVTDSLLERFRVATHPYDSVFITSNYLKKFLENGVDLGWTVDELESPKSVSTPPPSPKTPLPSPEFEKVKKQYEEAKSESERIIKNIAETKKVNVPESNDFVHQIGQKLETNDITMIIQSINGIRRVDEYLHTHSLNVAFLNGLMAKWLNYDRQKQDELIKAGLLHDIGKLLIPHHILNKPGRLTNDEFETVKKHSVYSFEMLVNSGIRDKFLLLGVAQHHEKLNGSGYPHGLKEKDISEFARVTAISDIYDAMVAKRVYKNAQSPFIILANFAKEGYSMLDIKLVKLFIDHMIYELKGKYTLLSNGSIAKVIMINERNLIYPLVEVEGEIIATSPELHCVSMYNADVSAAEIEKIYK